MRSRQVLAVLALATSAGGPAFGGAPVYENPSELTTTGDFDGDGRRDVVIVDRVTGLYRLGYQTAAGAFTWVAPRASGVQEVQGVAAGRLLSTSLDALAISAPGINRVQLVGAANPAVPGIPQPLFTVGVGPAALAALDIGGTANTAHDDLAVGTQWNSAPSAALELLRNNAGTVSSLQFSTLSHPAARAQACALKNGDAVLLVLLLRGADHDRVRAYRLASGTLTQVLAADVNRPPGADYVVDRFNGANALGQFLFYTPGTTGLALRAIQEPTPGNFALAAGPVFDLGAPVRQVFVLTGGPNPRLLVFFGEGDMGRVYDFDGANFPVFVEEFTAPLGQSLTTAAVLEGGQLLLLFGDGNGRSTGAARYAPSGASYVLQSSGALPVLRPLSHLANVLAFQFEPFVHREPNLLQSLTAADWTSGFSLGVGPTVSVIGETFVDEVVGLANPAIVNLGPVAGATQFGLVNQYTDTIAVSRLSPPLGLEIGHVRIAPPQGSYKTSVRVEFLGLEAGQEVYYRRSADPDWTLFTSPFWLFQDTVVSFYTRLSAANTRSPVRTAAYHFTQLPNQLDSDGDGVPDYVEIGAGLDPVESGNDGDGDGYFDLDELVSGFDATNPAVHPPSTESRPDLKGAVDLLANLRAYDGTAGQFTPSAKGTWVRAYDPEGNLLAIGTTQVDPSPAVPGPAAVLSNLVVKADWRLVSVVTEPHFDIATSSPDKRLGRELVRVLSADDLRREFSPPETWAGGALATETLTWIQAVSNTVASLARERVVARVNPFETLGALLLEKRIADLLANRGLPEYTALTLFPARAGDLGRPRLSADLLAALEQTGPAGQPAYRVPSMIKGVETALAQPPASDPYAALKQVTTEIYRISSAYNNPPLGAVTWPLLPSPVEALRQFLRDGTIPATYQGYVALSSNTFTAGLANAVSLLASLGPRPFTNVQLKVRTDSFQPACTWLDSMDGLSLWSLFFSNGAPYDIVEAFDLPAGSVVAVHGYTDISADDCGGKPIEVVSLILGSLPVSSASDTDGDLLPDALELALFGDLSQNGLGDADGDTFSNLQEYLDGTDLADSGNAGGVPVSFQLPAVQLIAAPGGSLTLQWNWPTAYAGKIQFTVLGTASLGTTFTPIPAAPVAAGPDTFEVVLPEPASASFFYQLAVSLK